ncbi:prepilin peptidase [Candidatus Saccharibacteria bacterium]|nr:prepilin peptidase [Candidatus Saccharibacteria bacterium]MBQ6150000.1 prepilin peptidase [Candidatus Saccharibacteria bacterium]
MQIAFLIFMFILGAAFGSFFCCQARRGEVRCSFEGHPQSLRGRSEEPRKDGRDERPEKEHELSNRSICLHCKKKLKWYDNIPIISWLVLRGKCRFCHKKIGYAEIISELSSAITLTMLGTTINAETANAETWLQFVLITIFTLSLLFLAIYDGISGKLPTIALIASVVLGVIAIIPSFITNFSPMPFISAALFGGIYLILYLISKGKWVGDGDWILAGAIGLVLGHPWLALMALFIANFSACLIMYPLVKKSKNHQIYFGPFLVLAFVITYTFRDIILLCIS